VKQLKNLLDFYIFSNIHVAIAGFCITKVTLLKYEISESITPLFVGLSIIISYNFIRYYEIKTNKINWLKNWYFKHQNWLLIVSILSSIWLVYITFFTSFYLNSLLILLPFAFMTFFYVIPIIRIGKVEFSFRNFPFIKIFSIAISWAGISVLFPLFEAEIKFTFDVYLEFIQRILILIVITIPFDIRDMNVDSKSLKTLPQIAGLKKIKIIGTGLLLIFILMSFLRINDLNSEMIVLIFTSILTGLLLWFSSPKNSRYYTSFWVESIPIVWLGFMLLY